MIWSTLLKGNTIHEYLRGASLICFIILTKKLSDIVFNSKDIAIVISDVDPNKTHGHDMISIFMLKICGESIHKPLEYIFELH